MKKLILAISNEILATILHVILLPFVYFKLAYQITVWVLNKVSRELANAFKVSLFSFQYLFLIWLYLFYLEPYYSVQPVYLIHLFEPLLAQFFVIGLVVKLMAMPFYIGVNLFDMITDRSNTLQAN